MNNEVRHHAEKVRGMLQDVVSHLRDDIGKIDDPQATALFETSAEVLEGLSKAFTHFENRSEEAWRK